MAILINSCPMCGANIKKEAKECDYCGSALIFTSMDVATLKVSNAIIEENTAKWKDILIESPEDARGNFNLGVIYLNKGLRDAAVDCFRKAVKAEADFTLAHYNLAIALFNDGHNEDGSEIRKEIKLTVLLDPNFSEKIANSIITLYLDKQLRDKLVNNVKISYKEKLSLENYTNNLLKLYKLI